MTRPDRRTRSGQAPPGGQALGAGGSSAGKADAGQESADTAGAVPAGDGGTGQPGSAWPGTSQPGEPRPSGRSKVSERATAVGVGITRRISAVAAFLGTAAVAALIAIDLITHVLLILAGLLCMVIAVSGAAYAITRRRLRRIAAVILVVLALAAPLALVAIYGSAPELILLLVLLVLIRFAARYALGRDLTALKSGPTPGRKVGPAGHPVLIMNPRSGDGKAECLGLADAASRRGISTVLLLPGDDLGQLARQAVADGADVIGMAGGDGSQALVADICRRHDVAFACIPAGTRNHLAMDLGLDREDLTGSLDAFGDAVERRIDLGLAGDRVFVNNATAGLYAKIVQSPEYRERKVGTALDMLPSMLGPDAAPYDLRYTGPDGTDHATAHLVLISNDPYELDGREGFGSRRRLDTGRLGIVTANFDSARDLARLVRLQAVNQVRRFPGWTEWTGKTFELRSDQPVEIGIDGEAMLLDPPIRFSIAPRALRVRIPRHAPGFSPAAAAPVSAWATVTALLRTIAGRPVAIASHH
ncbi:MAG TPA: diacylglycerol kinase family protein [Streptosporangiaceae bacterium]